MLTHVGYSHTKGGSATESTRLKTLSEGCPQEEVQKPFTEGRIRDEASKAAPGIEASGHVSLGRVPLDHCT